MVTAKPIGFLHPAPLIIGHRGAAGLAPENTLPSFALACTHGLHAVELDVYTLEQELIVIHDDTVDRTTNGKGEVAAFSLEALMTLDAGDGAAVPTLDDVWNLVPGNIGVNIELKGPGTAEPVAEWLARTAPFPPGRLMISSFDHEELAHFQQSQAGTDVLLAPLFHRWREGCVDVARRFETTHINFNHKLLNASRMARLSDARLKVCAYTVNTARRAKQLFDMGVHGIFTDRPDLMQEFVQVA